MRHDLDVQKFESLIKSKQYRVIRYYCEGKNSCRFAEIESPFYQKRFFVCIEKPYTLKVHRSAPIHYLNRLDDTDEDAPRQQAQYWKSVSEIDFVSISSRYFVYGIDDSIEYYELSVEPFESVNSRENKVQDFEEDVRTHVETTEPLHERSDDHERSDETETDVAERSDEKVSVRNLLGRDVHERSGEIEPLHEHRAERSDEKVNVHNLLRYDSGTSSEDQESEHGDSSESDESERDMFYFTSSSEDEDVGDMQLIPADIFSADYTIGQLYVCVGLKYFFSNAREFDEELVRRYGILHTRESDENEKRLENVFTLMDTLKGKLQTDFNEMTSQNREDQQHLHRLSKIIVKTTTMLKETPDNEKLLKTYRDSYHMIKDVNQRLVERRDVLFSLLNYSSMYMKELIS